MGAVGGESLVDCEPLVGQLQAESPAPLHQKVLAFLWIE
jgi:hypothetical protein